MFLMIAAHRGCFQRHPKGLSSFWFKSHMLLWHSVTTSSLREHGCFASLASRFAFCLGRGRGDMRRWLQRGRCGSNRAATQQNPQGCKSCSFQASQIDVLSWICLHFRTQKTLVSGRSRGPMSQADWDLSHKNVKNCSPSQVRSRLRWACATFPGYEENKDISWNYWLLWRGQASHCPLREWILYVQAPLWILCLIILYFHLFPA